MTRKSTHVRECIQRTSTEIISWGQFSSQAPKTSAWTVASNGSWCRDNSQCPPARDHQEHTSSGAGWADGLLQWGRRHTVGNCEVSQKDDVAKTDYRIWACGSDLGVFKASGLGSGLDAVRKRVFLWFTILINLTYRENGLKWGQSWNR